VLVGVEFKDQMATVVGNSLDCILANLGWVFVLSPYAVVGLALGFFCFRRGMLNLISTAAAERALAEPSRFTPEPIRLQFVRATDVCRAGINARHLLPNRGTHLVTPRHVFRAVREMVQPVDQLEDVHGRSRARYTRALGAGATAGTAIAAAGRLERRGGRSGSARARAKLRGAWAGRFRHPRAGL
jgi:hypothetical protein